MKIEEFLNCHAWSVNTRDRYGRALRLFESEVGGVESLDGSGFAKWLDKSQWGAASRWIAYTVLRGYITWECGAIHPAMSLRIKRGRSAPQRTLKLAAVSKLLASFDTMSVKGMRDLALCALALDTGLRCAELCALDQRYLDLEDQSLMVVCKGGDWKRAVYSNWAAGYVRSWLDVRPAGGGGAVFVSLRLGQQPGRLTRQGLQCIVKKWGIVSGVGRLSPHDLRRTFAVMATRRGAPARVLQVAGRWSSMEMVERYTAAVEVDDMAPYFPMKTVMG